MMKECALAPPSLSSPLALSQHGKVVWAQAESQGRAGKRKGSGCYRARRALSFHRGPQGGHLGSQICANEWTARGSSCPWGRKEGSAFLGEWKAVATVIGALSQGGCC